MLRFEPLAIPAPPEEGQPPIIMQHNALRRILSFLGHSLDEAISDPIVRNKVLAYWRVHKQIEVALELYDLQRKLEAPPSRR